MWCVSHRYVPGAQLGTRRQLSSARGPQGHPAPGASVTPGRLESTSFSHRPPWPSNGGAGCIGMDCRVWGPPGQYEASGVPGGCRGMSSPFLLRVAAQEGGPGSRSRSCAGVLQPELLREAPSLQTQGDACRPDRERGRGLGDDLRGAGFAKWAIACLGDFEEGEGHRGPGGSRSLEGTGPPTGPG